MQSGFTLIELVVVMVLIGILAVFAIPSNKADFTASNSATELMQAIRYAQQKSMDNTGKTNASITLSNDGFVFNNLSSLGLEWKLLKPAPAYTVTINPTGTITFNGQGVPSCTNTLALCFSNQTQPITVAANGNSVTIYLEPYTGFVHQ